MQNVLVGASLTCSEKRTLRGHAGQVNALAFVAGANGERVLVSAGVDRQLRMWHAHSGQLLRRAQLRAPLLDLLALSALASAPRPGSASGAGSCSTPRVCLPQRLSSTLAPAAAELDVPLFLPGALARIHEQLDYAFDRLLATPQASSEPPTDHVPTDSDAYKKIASQLLSLVSNTAIHSNT